MFWAFAPSGRNCSVSRSSAALCADNPISSTRMVYSTSNIGLGKTHSGFHFCLIPGLSWPCRKDANAVMGRHHPVAAIDFRVVERSPVHTGLQIVRDDEAWHPAKEPEHPDMGLDPVRKCLRPSRLRVG